jgi:hypothetical protein
MHKIFSQKDEDFCLDAIANANLLIDDGYCEWLFLALDAELLNIITR